MVLILNQLAIPSTTRILLTRIFAHTLTKNMILESVKLKKIGNTDQSPAFENVKKTRCFEFQIITVY